MFETRLHRFDENYALDKRKLWEGWLQWANRMSYLDSDNIARAQFGRQKFTIDAFIEMFSAGALSTDPAGVLEGATGTITSASKKIVSMDAFGDYWVTWSLTLSPTGETTAGFGDHRYAGGVAFIGDQIVGTAQDFKAEMGWHNNTAISNSNARGKDWGGLGEDNKAYELLYDDYTQLARFGTRRRTKWTTTGKWLVGSRIGSGDYIHLSGSGAASVPRVTGNIGVIIYCNPGATFSIKASTLTIHRRNR